VLRGNRFVNSGMPGQRKRKLKDGSEQHETLGSKKIRPEVAGANRTTEILKQAFNTNRQVARISEADRTEIKKKLFGRDTFENQRISLKLEKFEERRQLYKPPNAIQKQDAGMDLTPLMKGQIPFSKVRVNHQKENLLSELRHRLGVEFNSDLEKQGIRMLVDNLRKLETQRTGKEEDGFEPLSLELDRWGIKFGKRRQS
jgi:DNA mismatch repair ATPase MutL